MVSFRIPRDPTRIGPVHATPRGLYASLPLIENGSKDRCGAGMYNQRPGRWEDSRPAGMPQPQPRCFVDRDDALWSHRTRVMRGRIPMRVHLVNPSDHFIWYGGHHSSVVVCPGGSDARAGGRPILVDESLEQIVPESIAAEILLASACIRAMLYVATRLAGLARERGAWVVYGGIHATLYPGRGLGIRTSSRRGKGRWRRRVGQGVADCLPRSEQNL